MAFELGAFRFRLRSSKKYLHVEDYRSGARRALPKVAWTYLDGGADSLATLRANRRAFRCWALRQRVLTGSPAARVRTTVAGVELDLPVLLAPTGLTGLMHWHGELGAARAAERAGTRLVLSTASTYSLEEIAAGTAQSHWFQLYAWRDRKFIEELIERAAKSGFSVLFVTVDVPVLGNRLGEVQTGMAIPPVITPANLLDGLSHPRWSYGLARHRRISMRNLAPGVGAKNSVRSVGRHSRLMRPDLSWEDLSWLRSAWSGQLFVKGILDPDDADRAIDCGADGIVVSNHGGRQLDDAPAALEMLPAISAKVRHRTQVLFDGGIRSGADVIKAICLGANACLIGRAFLYGLATEGSSGVERVLKILRSEIERTLLLMGCPSTAELSPDWVLRAPVALTGCGPC